MIINSHCKYTTKKAEVGQYSCLFFCISRHNGYLPWRSLDTVSCLRPFLRRIDKTRRPLAVDIRWRKPCLFTLFLLWGWNVLFILFAVYLWLLFSFNLFLVHPTLVLSPRHSFLDGLHQNPEQRIDDKTNYWHVIWGIQRAKLVIF